MAEIDWDKFAERVPVNTIARCRLKDYTSECGVLIENYPYAEDEHRANRDDWGVKLYGTIWQNLSNYPALRFQWFDSLEESHILANSPLIQYLIDCQWLTFDEVMA